ncbi:MAG: malonyl-ACP O-methyltransferase BioC [Paracoccaceae bacterium]
MRDFQSRFTTADKVRRSFRRGFASYSETACVQAQVAEQLVSLLAEKRGGNPIAQGFEFGCGTGNLTRALTAEFSVRDLHLNDLVPDAERAARDVAENVGSVSFRAGDVQSVRPERRFDLIASASTVQWVSDQNALLEQLADMLAPGGWLALSSFGSAQFKELLALGSTAAAPGYLDAVDWQSALPVGLKLVAVKQNQITLSFPNARAVLRHLRDTGVNGRAQAGWTRTRLAAFEAEYMHRFGTRDGVSLTYDPVWVIAQKTD